MLFFLYKKLKKEKKEVINMNELVLKVIKTQNERRDTKKMIHSVNRLLKKRGRK